MLQDGCQENEIRGYTKLIRFTSPQQKKEKQNLIDLLDIYFKSSFYYERYMHRYSRNAELFIIQQHNIKMTEKMT